MIPIPTRHPRHEELGKFADQTIYTRASVRNHPYGLTVLTNDDPFYVIGKDEQQARWFQNIFQAHGGTKVHNRALHYFAMSTGMLNLDGTPYGSNGGGAKDRDWKDLQKGSKFARYLRLVNPRLITDKRNVPIKSYVYPRDTPEPSWELRGNEWSTPIVDSSIYETTFRFPTLEVTGYDYHVSDQPALLETWIEKSTMDYVLDPVCQRLGINLWSGTGFASVTRIMDFIERAQRYGTHAHIFYISDLDRAGESMPSAVARQLQFWIDEYDVSDRITLEPIALNKDQVDNAYPNLVQYEIVEKGRRKIELDALEALYPGELANILAGAVERFRDSELPGNLEAAEDEARETVEEYWWEAVDEYRTELDELRTSVSNVVEQFTQRQKQLAKEYNTAIAPHKAQLRELWAQVEDMVDDLDAELPERPQPNELDLYSRTGLTGLRNDGTGLLLLDSERDWWRQRLGFLLYFDLLDHDEISPEVVKQFKG